MKETDELISQLETAHTMIRDLVNQIEARNTLYPGWTLKEFLAHLTGWDEATIGSLRAHLSGTEPGVPAYRGINYYNAQSVEERVALDYTQVYREWEMARNTLKELVARIPEDKYKAPLLMPWSQMGSVKLLLDIMIHHAYEHVEDLHKLIGAVMAKPQNAPNIEDHDEAVVMAARDAIQAIHDAETVVLTPEAAPDAPPLTAVPGVQSPTKPVENVKTDAQSPDVPQSLDAAPPTPVDGARS